MRGHAYDGGRRRGEIRRREGAESGRGGGREGQSVALHAREAHCSFPRRR